jgi:DNA polymerase elongation subunit (family B)
MSKRSKSRLVVTVDIETCPIPERDLTASQKVRRSKETRSLEKKKPDMAEDELLSMAQSLTPLLGWICCISVLCARVRPDGGVNRGEPKSWTAEAPEGEEMLLRKFWQTVGGLNRKTTWVTFNGKWFDSPYIEARSVRWGVPVPARVGLLNTYPYSHKPHSDLAKLWRFHYSLDDLCRMLGVGSPKEAGFDGSMVADAVAEGRISEVARYCERDVGATLDCFLASEYAIDY